MSHNSTQLIINLLNEESKLVNINYKQSTKIIGDRITTSHKYIVVINICNRLRLYSYYSMFKVMVRFNRNYNHAQNDF